MKVGIKGFTSDPPSYFKKRDFADYIELMVEPGKSLEMLKDFDYEYVIHAPHVSFNVNPSSRHQQEHSIKAIKEAIAAAERLNAKIIIVHPGYRHTTKDTKDFSAAIMRQTLSQLKDRRIVLENCPYLDDWNGEDDYYYCYDQKSMERFSAPFNGRICLDFSHAIISARELRMDWKKLVAGLLASDVRIFHLCDGIANARVDKHLPLFEGDFDLEYLKRVINKSRCKRVTLETSMDLQKQRKEYDWLKS